MKPKFIYKQKVKIVKGFYRGLTRKVLEYSPEVTWQEWFISRSLRATYLIRIEAGKFHAFGEDELESV